MKILRFISTLSILIVFSLSSIYLADACEDKKQAMDAAKETLDKAQQR